MVKENQIIIALDTNNLSKAMNVIKAIDNDIIFKLGMEFFYTFGYEGIKKVKKIRPNIKIFLDLKLHDIPNTVCKAIPPLIKNVKPHMMTIHSTGGSKMMREVVKLFKEKPKTHKPMLLGVTVLTSLDSIALEELGWKKDMNKNVINYSLLCKESGLDGVICSALEIEGVRKACGKNFKIVTPGIRLQENNNDDQARVVTPNEAIRKGTDYIVIGRPILNSSNPRLILSKILKL